MPLRVERLADLAERGEAELLGRRPQLRRDRRERRVGLEIAVLLGTVEVVEHGQQHRHRLTDRALALELAVRLGALAVVRVLGRDPLEVGEVLVGRLLHLGLGRVQDVVDRELVVVGACPLAELVEAASPEESSSGSLPSTGSGSSSPSSTGSGISSSEAMATSCLPRRRRPRRRPHPRRTSRRSRCPSPTRLRRPRLGGLRLRVDRLAELGLRLRELLERRLHRVVVVARERRLQRIDVAWTSFLTSAGSLSSLSLMSLSTE